MGTQQAGGSASNQVTSHACVLAHSDVGAMDGARWPATVSGPSGNLKRVWWNGKWFPWHCDMHTVWNCIWGTTKWHLWVYWGVQDPPDQWLLRGYKGPERGQHILHFILYFPPALVKHYAACGFDKCVSEYLRLSQWRLVTKKRSCQMSSLSVTLGPARSIFPLTQKLQHTAFCLLL